MKKVIFLILISFFTSQVVNAKKLFVEMEFHKNCIKLDDGTNKKHQKLKDAEGNDVKFISLIGALNYMSLQGWELVETKSVTKGSGSVGTYGGGSYTDTKVYYIFCKEVSDDELKQAVENSYKEK